MFGDWVKCAIDDANKAMSPAKKKMRESDKENVLPGLVDVQPNPSVQWVEEGLMAAMSAFGGA
eukprot:3520515-Karenia_brevis.AAC.1